MPGSPMVKNLPANAGDTGSVPALGWCHMPRGTKSVHHGYGACALEPTSCNYLSSRNLKGTLRELSLRKLESLCVHAHPCSAQPKYKTKHNLI